jgi:hypothetical protein
MWATSAIFKNLPKVNNHPMGESGHPDFTALYRNIDF